MTPGVPPPNERSDWSAIVARHARAAGIDLSPSTVDELAAHLEDLYLAAVQRGADRAERAP